MSFTVKAFDEIIADIVSWTIANSSKITDMTPGSVIRSFCEGASLSMEEIYVSVYLGFKRYLANVQETTFDFARKAGTKATVDVVFARSVANGEITIPIGTRVKTPSGLRFYTTEVATILTGQMDSGSTEVEAESVGIAYNIGTSPGIEILEDIIAGVDTVSNALAATGGVDIETDIAYKKRFQDYVEGLGRSNLAGFSEGALSVEGITSVSIHELFPPVANVNVDLYIDDGSSSGVSSDQITEVQGVIDGDGTEDKPGYRAAGVNVVVKKPTAVQTAVTATVTVLAGVDSDQIESDIVDSLTAYVNVLAVGKDIIFNELVAAIMNVYGVVNVSFTTPTADVTITSSQVGRLGTVTITQV